MTRPHVTLKLATSLDGKIALANGQSQWITSEESRSVGRRLRAQHDAICVGANTAILDNPRLTTRQDGLHDPVRIIFDSHLRLSPQSHLAKTARGVPVWVFCLSDKGRRAKQLQAQGVTLITAPHKAGLDISVILETIHVMGINSLLIEGGGTLAASFIKEGCVDVIEWFRAPILIGHDGRSAIGELGLNQLFKAYKFNCTLVERIGPDIHETYERTD